MSKSGPSDNFVPDDGSIREDVLHHQVEHIFGRGASYRKSKAHHGWIITNGKTVTQKRLRELQVATDTVKKVLREREREQRRAAPGVQQSNPRQPQPTSGRSLPTWDDDQSTMNETSRTNCEDPDDDDTDDEIIGHRSPKAEPKDRIRSSNIDRHKNPISASPPTRTSSLPIRESTLIQPSQNFYQDFVDTEVPQIQQQTHLRNDGHSPRGSSLHVSSAPVDVPARKNRHQIGYDGPGTYKDSTESYTGSFNRTTTNPRPAAHRPLDPSFAARQIDRVYEEDDFLDPLEWRQYKREKAQYQERARRRRDQPSEEEDYSEDEPPKSRHRDALPASSTNLASGQDAKNVHYELSAPKRSSHGSKKYRDDDTRPRTERTEISIEDGERRSLRRRDTESSTVISNSEKRKEQGYVAGPGRRR